jgi:O-antigen ligase
MAAIAATCCVSIFAAQAVGLSLATVVFLVRLARGQARLERSPLDGPILAFCVWTLLSAAFSPDPWTSHDHAKKLVLFALFYLSVEALSVAKDRERILDAALLGGLALSAGAIVEYYFLGFDTLANRPHSFLGHYMTASGLIMAVLVIAAARLAFHRGRWPRPSAYDVRALGIFVGGMAVFTAAQAFDLFAVETERLFVAGVAAAGAFLALSRGPWPGEATSTALASLVVPVAAWAAVVSRTRNAWLGAMVGLAVVAVLRAPRALWALAAAVALVLVVRPAPVVGRLTVFDPSSVDRYYMWQAGIDMIRDKPVFGQGPGRILAVYPQYRWPEAPNAQQPHLHDNALQIAAERGLPCLVWWLWFVAAAMADAWREARGGGGWAAAAALAFLAAFMAAGLFEYNFGDSEILMFTLLVSAIPYALRRERARA